MHGGEDILQLELIHVASAIYIPCNACADHSMFSWCYLKFDPAERFHYYEAHFQVSHDIPCASAHREKMDKRLNSSVQELLVLDQAARPALLPRLRPPQAPPQGSPMVLG
ncbi:hypothetical protein SCAR479_02666 [Seiridium cardinale]|uniref:Uncharacterized protein n=1 Tax=Seiridium cardinale TaxID=138064 RepID=A0ABR2Y3B3_9PEZI